MVKSIHRAVWDWLRTCPAVKSLSFEYGTEGNGSMILRPTRELEESYSSGKELYSYACELTCFKPLTFDANDDGNITMLESVDEISDWIRAQVDEGRIPELPEDCTYSDFDLFDNQTEFAIAQDGMYAKYVVPFRIYYIKE